MFLIFGGIGLIFKFVKLVMSFFIVWGWLVFVFFGVVVVEEFFDFGVVIFWGNFVLGKCFVL